MKTQEEINKLNKKYNLSLTTNDFLTPEERKEKLRKEQQKQSIQWWLILVGSIWILNLLFH